MLDDSSLSRTSLLVFSPDGDTLAGRIDGDKIAVWDADTGMENHVFSDTGFIESLLFSPDGQTLAGGCEDGTVLLWNVEVNKKDVVLIEEKEPYQNRTTQIQQFCMEHNITTLIHFTRIKHLHSILQRGLLSRRILEKRNVHFLSNDDKRLDNHKEGICLSISFPNYQLFNKFSRPNKNSSTNYSDWIVLLLDVRILWELDCAFCQENASSGTIRYKSLEERKKPEALEDLFLESYRDTHKVVYKRDLQEIPTQAEVLVFNHIPIEYIKEVHFYEKAALTQWRTCNPGDYPPKLLFNCLYFRYPQDRETD